MEIKILKSTNVLQCIYINAIRMHRNLDFVSFLITLESAKMMVILNYLKGSIDHKKYNNIVT